MWPFEAHIIIKLVRFSTLSPPTCLMLHPNQSNDILGDVVCGRANIVIVLAQIQHIAKVACRPDAIGTYTTTVQIMHKRGQGVWSAWPHTHEMHWRMGQGCSPHIAKFTCGLHIDLLLHSWLKRHCSVVAPLMTPSHLYSFIRIWACEIFCWAETVTISVRNRSTKERTQPEP